MTISSTNRKAGPFAGNDVTVDFPFAFKVFDVDDVLVVFTSLLTVESTLEIGTDYSVSLNLNQDSNPGGTVTLVSALATGTKLTLTSAVENKQPAALTNQGGFYPRVINDALDRLTILVQQLAEQVSRAVKIGISSSASPDEMLADISEAAAISQAAAITASAAALAAEDAAAAITLPIPVASGGTGSTSATDARTAFDVPSKTGSGASGTWGISITGSIPDSAVSSPTKINDGVVTPAKTELGALPSCVRLNTANGYGSTNTMIRRFTTTVINQGADSPHTDSATLGGGFTIARNGVYAMSYSDAFTTSQYFGISINSTQLTTAINSINAANVIAIGLTGGAGSPQTVAVTTYLSAGDVVRAHTTGVASSGPAALFTIQRVA